MQSEGIREGATDSGYILLEKADVGPDIAHKHEPGLHDRQRRSQ
jgi:hypothetical protein